MDYEKHFDKILLDQEKMMLDNMIKDCKNSSDKSNLQDILTYLTHKNKEIKKKNYVESDIQKRLSNIDEYLFKRPWNKLELVHKKIKLDEYIKNYLFKCSDENLEEIKKKLFNDLNNKKLNSIKKVNYDPISSKIISIVNLVYNTDDCIYTYK